MKLKWEKIILNILCIMMIIFVSGGCASDSKRDENADTASSKTQVIVTDDRTEMKGQTFFHDGYEFSDDVAWVKSPLSTDREQGEWYCINTKGEELFGIGDATPTSNFINGAATLDNGDIIDKKGNVICGTSDGKYTEILSVEDGYIFVRYEKNDFSGSISKIGIIDSNGEWYMEPTEDLEGYNNKGNGLYSVFVDSEVYYDLVQNEFVNSETYKSRNFKRTYQEDLFFLGSECENDIFRIGEESYSTEDVLQDNKRGFYDEKGNLVIDLSTEEYNQVFDISNGFHDGYCLLEIRKTNGNFIVAIDKEGNFMFEPMFRDEIYESCSSDYLSIQNEDGTYNYMDLSGKIIAQSRTFPYNYKCGIMKIGEGYPKDDVYYLDNDGNPAF